MHILIGLAGAIIGFVIGFLLFSIYFLPSINPITGAVGANESIAGILAFSTLILAVTGYMVGSKISLRLIKNKLQVKNAEKELRQIKERELRIKEEELRKEELRIKEEESRKEELRIKAIEKQKNLYSQMIHLRKDSIAKFELLSSYLIKADKYLKQAEIDFAEHAYNPYWDSFEETALALRAIDDHIQILRNNIYQYISLADEYKGIPPVFFPRLETLEKLIEKINISDQLKVLYRTAHQDPHFALIFTQRKTNQILLQGFNNIGNAIEQMTDSITDSTNTLERVMQNELFEINATIKELDANIFETNFDSTAQLKLLVEREDRALLMLDNIQRGDKPIY